MDTTQLPVAVVGAGPVGLAAAAHLAQRGLEVVVLERGDAVGAAVRSWGHVRLFSPWRYNTDPAAAALLAASGWTPPDPDALPTGRELVEQYLEPLAAHPAIAPRLRLRARVIAVARAGHDKTRGGTRSEAPFTLRIDAADGEQELLARAVIDASGTYGWPNPLGASGLPAIGEAEAAEWIAYGVPDVRGAERRRYAGKRVLVVGSGHSAMGAVLDLAALAEQAAGTTVTWAVRRPAAGLMFGGGAGDALPARGSIGARARQLVESGRVRLVTNFATTGVTRGADGVRLTTGAGSAVDASRRPAGRQPAGADAPGVIGPFDRVIVATGFRPDLAPLRELRLALDPIVESPVRLAPLIDPNLHSCGSVPPHGYEELRHPEPDVYLVGAKSYGRAPTVLMRTGYEQVRSVVAALAGDMAAALDVRLVLPETGVCSTDLESGACCQPAATPAGTLRVARFVALPPLALAPASARGTTTCCDASGAVLATAQLDATAPTAAPACCDASGAVLATAQLNATTSTAAPACCDGAPPGGYRPAAGQTRDQRGVEAQPADAAAGL